MDINDIKPDELQEIIDFYYFIKDFGHIYHFPENRLDAPFNKIIEGINEVRNYIDDSYSM